MNLPLSPAPPARIPTEVWERICLAKRRLAVLGPLEAGQQAARASALTLASELRLAAIPLEAAVELARRLTFTADTTPRHRVIKQMENAAVYAYRTKDRLPIRTGCCQDPRPRSSGHTGGKLRSYFEPYCDEDCAKTCRMLAAIKQPLTVLFDTPFAAIVDSNLWQHGGRLNDSGRLIFQMLAGLALGEPDTEVYANANYITAKLGGRYSVRQVRRVLKQLAKECLIEIREGGHILVRAPGADELTAIELRLNVHGRREANLREALTERSRLDDWHALVASQAGDPEAVDAWNPPG